VRPTVAEHTTFDRIGVTGCTTVDDTTEVVRAHVACVNSTRGALNAGRAAGGGGGGPGPKAKRANSAVARASLAARSSFFGTWRCSMLVGSAWLHRL
jgi:hypothetical protein